MYDFANSAIASQFTTIPHPPHIFYFKYLGQSNKTYIVYTSNIWWHIAASQKLKFFVTYTFESPLEFCLMTKFLRFVKFETKFCI